jgi:hypothetical protein
MMKTWKTLLKDLQCLWSPSLKKIFLFCLKFPLASPNLPSSFTSCSGSELLLAW